MAKGTCSLRLGTAYPCHCFTGYMSGVSYDSFVDYIEKTDHIDPFSVDDWRLALDSTSPAQIELAVGLVPFEITTDKVLVRLDG